MSVRCRSVGEPITLMQRLIASTQRLLTHSRFRQEPLSAKGVEVLHLMLNDTKEPTTPRAEGRSAVQVVDMLGQCAQRVDGVLVGEFDPKLLEIRTLEH